MKLVAGIGNPGDRYRGTRHNVGFDVVDELARRHGVEWASGPADALEGRWRRDAEGVVLAKPLTFVNLSGEAVAALMRFYKIGLEDVLIVTDDVNLPLGRLRARGTGSEGGHNGLRSVARQLGTIDYARLRVGVGRGEERRDLAGHVLAPFEPGEQDAIQEAIVRAADAVETWVRDGLVQMMNAFNRTNASEDAERDGT